jgi:hypothetical protein
VRNQFAAFAIVITTAFASSTGQTGGGQILDPAVHGLKRLEPLTFGSEQDNTHMQPAEYRLKVGQGYRLKIIATPGAEYAFVAPTFLRNVWIRKIEVGEVEIKSATLDELEFENGGEAEIFFVAIRPGDYEFGSRGLMARGVAGKIIVESADAPQTQQGSKPNNADAKTSQAEADDKEKGEAKAE